MATRMRSPNYPATPLREAIDVAGKIFSKERSNAIDRAVAAQAAGYSGLSGRSAKVLADLAMYGLLERAGKSETRISRRAIEILHPDSPSVRSGFIRDAAFEPELFQRVRERFPDGLPSPAALKSYFLKEGFTDAAIGPAIRAYLQTAEFVEQQNASGSYGVTSDNDVESQRNQHSSRDDAMQARVDAPVIPLPPPTIGTARMDFDWPNKRMNIALSVGTRAEAQEVLDFVSAMLRHLPPPSAVQPDDAEGSVDS